MQDQQKKISSVFYRTKSSASSYRLGHMLPLLATLFVTPPPKNTCTIIKRKINGKYKIYQSVLNFLQTPVHPPPVQLENTGELKTNNITDVIKKKESKLTGKTMKYFIKNMYNLPCKNHTGCHFLPSATPLQVVNSEKNYNF